MIRNRATLVIALVLMIASTAATLGAQDFGGEVTQDPKAGLAIYDFHFDGPPRGHAALFVSLGLGAQPLQLGPIGALYLDPAFFPVSPFMPLDLAGRNSLQLRLPQQLTNDLTFCFQAVFIDTRGALRVPPKFLPLAQGKKKQPKHETSYGIGYDLGQTSVDFKGCGKPGTKLTLRIYDKQKRLVGTVDVTIGKDGKSPTSRKNIGAKVQKGHTWQVWETEGSTSILIATGGF